MNALMKAFATTNSWHNKMSQSGLDSYDNYIGSNLGDSVVVAVARSRDSEILAISNFQMALEMLGGESDTVTVERFGHWANGWFELILINSKDEKAIAIAMDIDNKLKEYPVLDEDDFCVRENEYFTDYAESAKKELAEALCSHFGGISNSKALLNVAVHLNYECQHYAGSDSCINVYSMREPTEGDLERLYRVLEQVVSNCYYEADSLELAIINYLIACLGKDNCYAADKLYS